MILVLFRFLTVLALLWLTACLEVVGCRPGQFFDLSIQSLFWKIWTCFRSIYIRLFLVWLGRRSILSCGLPLTLWLRR